MALIKRSFIIHSNAYINDEQNCNYCDKNAKHILNLLFMDKEADANGKREGATTVVCEEHLQTMIAQQTQFAGFLENEYKKNRYA